MAREGKNDKPADSRGKVAGKARRLGLGSRVCAGGGWEERRIKRERKVDD